MSKYIDKKTGETRYFIPIDGKYRETNEEIHEIYYKMDRRERYLQERSKEYELSFEGLEAASYPVEMNMMEKQQLLEEQIITNDLIERMLSVLPKLSEQERWIIDELFFKGTSEVALSKETGLARTTIQSRKYVVLKKIREMMME